MGTEMLVTTIALLVLRTGELKMQASWHIQDTSFLSRAAFPWCTVLHAVFSQVYLLSSQENSHGIQIHRNSGWLCNIVTEILVEYARISISIMRIFNQWCTSLKVRTEIQSKKNLYIVIVTSSPKGNDRSPESNVPRSNLISKNSNSSKL